MNRGGGPGQATAYPIFEGKSLWGKKIAQKKKNSCPKKFLLPTQSKISCSVAPDIYISNTKVAIKIQIVGTYMHVFKQIIMIFMIDYKNMIDDILLENFGIFEIYNKSIQFNPKRVMC